MFRINSIRIRVLVLTGTLFFFTDCAGRVKPWKFYDTHSLDVRVLDAKQWLDGLELVMSDLDEIMDREIRFYLDNDIRIYDRIDPSYDAMTSSIARVDSVIKKITSIYDLMKNTPGDTLESVPEDSSLSYSKMIRSSSKDIALAKKTYFRGLKNLKKGFRKDRRKLVFIEDEYAHYQKTLYELKFKRDQFQMDLKDFDKILSQVLFKDDGSFYTKNVIRISKRLESYEEKMDAFERFLLNIDKIALNEVGGRVILRSAANKNPMKFMKRYDRGSRQYLETLKDMRKILENI